jgi:hypothetical protein
LKKSNFYTILFLASLIWHASSLHAQTLQEPSEQKPAMLLGSSSPKLLEQAPFAKWFIPNFEKYQVDSSLIPAIRKAFKGKRIEFFVGTWCGESRADMPGVLKILQAAEVDSSQFKLIFLNNSGTMNRQSPGHEEQGKNIVRVPTYILYKGKKEIGRIIDAPVESFEKDLLKILTGKPYTPHFSELIL